jgi:hypothetical protein
MRSVAPVVVVLVLALTVSAAVVWAGLTGTASHEREWIVPQSRLPGVSVSPDGRYVDVSAFRRFRHRAEDDFDARWTAERIDVSGIESVWLLLSRFSDRWRGPAHAWLSFGMADGTFVSVSIEARREVGETYSVVDGMRNRFETIFVVGDEEDLLALRADVWRTETYVYPTRATPAQAQAVFLDLMRQAERIERQPEFYHTTRRNCVTPLARAIRSISGETVRFRLATLLPGYADQEALRLGLLATDLDIDEARERFRAIPGGSPDGGPFAQRMRRAD